MQQQSQQQISQIKEILKFMGPLTFHGNMLTELEKDVKNFSERNLRYFNKNCYEYNKDKYILDIITNGLKLDLKNYQLKISDSLIPHQIKKLLKNLVIV